GAPAQHIAGAHHQRIADVGGVRHGFGLGARRAVGRLAQTQLVEQLLEALAVFGHVDGFGAGADDGHTVGFERARQLQRGLAAILDDHAHRVFFVDDFEHVFERERLEVQAIGSVVVGGDGFRVAIDHDGLVPVVAQGQGGVHAAVVELDALPDTVGAAAEHDDFLAVGRLRLALVFVRGIHVRGAGGELGRAGIDALVHGTHIELVAQLADLGFGGIQQERQAAIGEPHALELPQRGVVEVGQRLLFERQFDVDDFLDLRQEPGVDAGDVVDFVEGEPLREGVAHVPDALGARFAQFDLELFAVGGFLVQAVNADLKAAQGFLERFFERPADGHDFAHRLHLGGQAGVGLREFLEGKTRHLGDHVVDGGLERGRRGAAGDLVAQLVERVAHGQACGDLGYGEAGGLGGQGRRARHARVHFDDDHAAVIGIDRELYVGPAGVDADFTQHRDRGVAHDLVFLVGQRLGWRDSDGIAGVHPHGVEVLDRTHDDAVVGLVAHDFHLEFFPAQQRLFDEQFAGGRGFETATADDFEFFGVVGNAAARAAHGEAGADDRGEPGSAGFGRDAALDFPGFVHAVGDTRLGRLQADVGHGLLELLAVFGLFDGMFVRADEFHAVLGQHTVAGEVERAVQGGLPAHGGQQGIGLFADR